MYVKSGRWGTKLTGCFVLLFAVTITLSGCEEFFNDLRDIDTEELMRVEMLYVQTAASGTFTPLNIDQSPRYRLQFYDVAPITNYFSDKPNRVAGTLTMGEFFDLGLFNQYPVHTAVMLRNHNNRNEDLVMGILSNPSYDPVSQILGFDIFVLPSVPEISLDRWPGMQDMQLARSFGEVSIFISSEICPPSNLAC